MFHFDTVVRSPAVLTCSPGNLLSTLHASTALLQVLLHACLCPAALRYEDFEALLQGPVPTEDKQTSSQKVPMSAAKVNRPRGGLQRGGRDPAPALLSRPTLGSSSSSDSPDEPAPVLMRPPKGFRRKAPGHQASPYRLQPPTPALLGRPAKPISSPVELDEEGGEDREATEAEKVQTEEQAISEGGIDNDANQLQEVEKPHKPTQRAKSGNAEDQHSPPALVKPVLFPSKKVRQAQTVSPSRPAPAELPALLRPAVPLPDATAAKEEEQWDRARYQAKLGRSTRLRKQREREEQAVAAVELAQPVAATQPLELISRPSQKKLSQADSPNPASWDLINVDDFAAENLDQMKGHYIAKAILAHKKAAEAPQLPPPPLAERPARAQPGSSPPAVAEPLGSLRKYITSVVCASMHCCLLLSSLQRCSNM